MSGFKFIYLTWTIRAAWHNIRSIIKMGAVLNLVCAPIHVSRIGFHNAEVEPGTGPAGAHVPLNAFGLPWNTIILTGQIL